MRRRAKCRRSISRNNLIMRRLLLALSFLASIAAHAWAEEGLRNFVSDVAVNADASLAVSETITVAAEGYDIKHGILRDFPTTYPDRHGQRVRVGFEVLEVTRDGKTEPYAVESLPNGKRISAGAVAHAIGPLPRWRSTALTHHNGGIADELGQASCSSCLVAGSENEEAGLTSNCRLGPRAMHTVR